MKILTVFLFLFVLSCAKEPIEDPIAPIEDKRNLLLPRSLVDRDNISISNPDLLNNWENLSEVVLNSATQSTPSQVVLPWGNRSSTTLPAHMLKKPLKDDGWIMLFHTFVNKSKCFL